MNKKFFEVHTKATDELERAVAEELKKDDPDEETAKAILDGPRSSTDDTESK